MLKNGNFSNGWETLAPVAGFLRNQRPNDWQLEWLEKGEPLYADPNAKSDGVPECLHKLSKQLPERERLGGPNALILSGDATYKIFHFGAPFGASLSQTVSGLKPGSEAKLTVPIQVHLHGEQDAYGAESSVWVNDVGGWVNGFDMGDRQWHKHVINFTVPENGTAEIVIRVKSKWPRPKDFFFDGITLEAVEAEDTPIDKPPKPQPKPAKIVQVQLPAGFELREGSCDDTNVIEINVPVGVAIKVVEN